MHTHTLRVRAASKMTATTRLAITALYTDEPTNYGIYFNYVHAVCYHIEETFT